MKGISSFIKVLAILFTLFVASSISGCAGNSYKIKAYEPEYKQDVATVHVSVMSVIPWDEYKEKLQPKFKLEEADALTKVIPTTSYIDEKIIDAFSANIKAALPSTTKTVETSTEYTSRSENNDSQDADTKKTSSSENKSKTTKKTEPVNLSDATPATSPTKVETPSETIKNKTPQRDPMLEYLAATALFQEVQLLNGYIENAAIDGKNYEPYIVRLQLSLMPKANNIPYDTYEILSFFVKDKDLVGGATLESIKAAAASNKEKLGALLKELTEVLKDKELSDEDISNALNNANANGQPKGIKVIPLLVTDNLEGILHSRSEDKIRQFAILLSAVTSNLSANFGLDRKMEYLMSELGTDINSLMTIGRASDNSIKVRLGAMKQSGQNHFMVPRTHNITLLILVPKSSNAVTAVTKTDFAHHNAKSLGWLCKWDLTHDRLDNWLDDVNLCGAIKDDRDRAFEKELKNINSYYKNYKNYKLNLTYENIRDLLSATQNNDYDKFAEIMKKNPVCTSNSVSCEDLAKQIWTDIANLNSNILYSNVSFSLPKDNQLNISPKQSITLLDDGKVTTATLQGLTGYSSDDLGAVLHVKIKDKTVDFVSSNIVNKPKLKQTSFIFPSLSAWGYNSTSKASLLNVYDYNKEAPDNNFCNKEKNKSKPSCLCKNTNNDSNGNENKKELIACIDKIKYIAPKKDVEPVIKADKASKTIVVNKDGAGSLTLTFTKIVKSYSGKIHVEFIEADISDFEANSTKIEAKDGEYIFAFNNSETATAKIAFKNVANDEEITYIIKDDNGGSKEETVKASGQR